MARFRPVPDQAAIGYIAEHVAATSIRPRAQHGILSAEMSALTYDRLGQVTPVVEIPAAGHHVMLDQPIALAAALRTLLAGWDHSLPAEARAAL